MPAINGLLETALYVNDLKNSADFYRRVFGFETLLDTDRLVALDVAGRNVLLLFKQGATSEAFSMPGGVIPGHNGQGSNHFAFSIDKDDFEDWKERLEDEGAVLESTVTWDGGAQSIYFRDPDNHLGELITPGF